MTLTGRPLVLALLGCTLVGVGAGTFLDGWRKARGLPVECHADAGVQLAVDAGVSTESTCAATVEHWTTITVPGPIRYLPGDAGVAQPEVVTLLVPDVRLSAAQHSSSAAAASGEATATASATPLLVPPERHWELGPSALVSTRGQVLAGGEAGWSTGPFGVRVQVLAGDGSVYAGGALVWRW